MHDSETQGQHAHSRRQFLARMAGVAGAVLVPSVTGYSLTGVQADELLEFPGAGEVVTASNTNTGSNTNTNLPADKQACKDGGWTQHTDEDGEPFRNQGQCVSYVARRKAD